MAAQVIVTVQFAPVILVPKTSSAGDSLVRATEASHSALISWLRDGAPLDPSGHSVSSETTLCTTRSRLEPLASSNHPHNYILRRLQQTRTVRPHAPPPPTGELIPPTTILRDPPEEEAPEGKRRFNVTGFIVGMLPPPLHLLLHHLEARLQVALRGRARGGLRVQGGALLHQLLTRPTLGNYPPLIKELVYFKKADEQ
ncbi:hypothetical protein CEXT_324191 [Caerostris extrusa]|uniref:Uncharacterized protein n=1 Tax=Caerostris extrusa TaxID=172846 RepID=A0AAV4QS81_CAEEX|nr:hypothetical protein CEXT_324191 [Caerostris extrusa]